MAKLKKRNQTPPGGWKFKNSTGFWLEGRTLESLVANVILHRKRNDKSAELNPQLVEEEVVEQICSTLDSTWCKEIVVQYQDQTKTLKLDKITSIARAALSLIKDSELVDHEELTRRQAICNRCFLNKPAQGCACATVYKMVDKAIPENRRDEGLQVCGACGCMINAKIQLKPNAVKEANKGKDYKYPSFCWQNDLPKEKKVEVKKEEVKPKPVVEKKKAPTVKKKVAKAKKKVSAKKKA
jgi:transcriptional antiterminator Rof (Rho-off)